jgi:hypothetical protein
VQNWQCANVGVCDADLQNSGYSWEKMNYTYWDILLTKHSTKTPVKMNHLGYYLPADYQNEGLPYSSLRNYVGFLRQKKMYIEKLQKVLEVLSGGGETIYQKFEEAEAKSQEGELMEIVSSFTLLNRESMSETGKMLSSCSFLFNASKLGIFPLVSYFCQKYVCTCKNVAEIFKGICRGSVNQSDQGLCKLIGVCFPGLLEDFVQKNEIDALRPKVISGANFFKNDSATIDLPMCLENLYIGHDGCIGCSERSTRRYPCHHCLLMDTLQKYVVYHDLDNRPEVWMKHYIYGRSDIRRGVRHENMIRYIVDQYGMIDNVYWLEMDIVQSSCKKNRDIFSKWLNAICRDRCNLSVHCATQSKETYAIKQISMMFKKNGWDPEPDIWRTYSSFETPAVMNVCIRWLGGKTYYNSGHPEDENVNIHYESQIAINHGGSSLFLTGMKGHKLKMDIGSVCVNGDAQMLMKILHEQLGQFMKIKK